MERSTYLERTNPFNDPLSLPFLQSLPETLIEVPASIIPLFGRTQYRRGAVVFTLKHTFLSVGLESLRFVVTTSENGPVRKRNKVKARAKKIVQCKCKLSAVRRNYKG